MGEIETNQLNATPIETPASTREAIAKAARVLANAQALLVTAGAGLGVDSGLPDFRGDEGFWKAYPPLKTMNISFSQMANPQWFRDEPALAWGFYGHRQNLYRATAPHAGFSVLKKWAAQKSGGAFIFSSNVDGQFQKAGFDANAIVECHGSIHHLQCTAPCSDEIWRADDVQIEVDAETFRALGDLPLCPHCGALARPNILMFGDGGWIEKRTRTQLRRESAWLESVKKLSLVVIECGAGTAIPSVRRHGETLASTRDMKLIRINKREAESASVETISLFMGAREALEEIDAALQNF